ncbi:MAG: CPBP family intramembrane glutamic endopeptidase [Planctomycetota bacterium]
MARGGSRTRKWLEFLALFVGIPLWLAWAKLFGSYRVPVIPVLIGLTLFVTVILVFDRRFRWREAIAWRWSRGAALGILGRFAILGAALSALVAMVAPHLFLSFPRENPGLWALVMIGYPVLSVVPQEFLYRVFFFHRYEDLLGGAVRTSVHSALLFGVAHLLFGSWISVVLTAIGGWFFATTYARTRSLWLASFEHALYGQLVFTVGLGQYFYGGTVQMIDGAS